MSYTVKSYEYVMKNGHLYKLMKIKYTGQKIDTVKLVQIGR